MNKYSLILCVLLLPACEADTVAINAVQGNNDTSPYANQEVHLNPVIVTAVGEEGFFIQTPSREGDQDPGTSEGLYVFTGHRPDVARGELIRLSGRVAEFHGLTELTNPRILAHLGNSSLPDAVTLARRDVNLEAVEAMRISLASATVIQATDRHGDALLVPGDKRLLRRQAQPDSSITQLEINPDALGLDDVVLVPPRNFAARGILTYGYGDYVVWPTSLDLGPAPALPLPVREARPGEIAIASFNMKLFYDEQRVAGEPVEDPHTFNVRLDKLAAWLNRVLQCPAVVAVQEVEARDVLQRLGRASGCDYQAFGDNRWRDMPGLGFLVRVDALPPVRVRSWGDDLELPDGHIVFDRPPLVLNLQFDKPLVIINVHQRSMLGLGEEPWVNDKRRAQALALRRLIEDIHESGRKRILVLGDFNALPFDDGYADILGLISGGEVELHTLLSRLPVEQRYSYIYRGWAQALDHVLVSAAAQPLVTDFAYARGNADAPAALAHQAGSLLRASDHDPLLVYLTNLRTD